MLRRANPLGLVAGRIGEAGGHDRALVIRYERGYHVGDWIGEGLRRSFEEVGVRFEGDSGVYYKERRKARKRARRAK